MVLLTRIGTNAGVYFISEAAPAALQLRVQELPDSPQCCTLRRHGAAFRIHGLWSYGTGEKGNTIGMR